MGEFFPGQQISWLFRVPKAQDRNQDNWLQALGTVLTWHLGSQRAGWGVVGDFLLAIEMGQPSRNTMFPPPTSGHVLPCCTPILFLHFLSVFEEGYLFCFPQTLAPTPMESFLPQI